MQFSKEHRFLTYAMWLLSAAGAQADTFTVSQGGEPGTYGTIAAALAVADEGDVVELSPGIYQENVVVTLDDVVIKAKEEDSVEIHTSGWTINADDVRVDSLSFFSLQDGVGDGFFVLGDSFEFGHGRIEGFDVGVDAGYVSGTTVHHSNLVDNDMGVDLLNVGHDAYTHGVLQGEWAHYGPFYVAPGEHVKARMRDAGGQGDADLYVRVGAQPTLSEFHCRPWTSTSDEDCDVVAGGTSTQAVYVSVNGWAAQSGYDLSITSDAMAAAVHNNFFHAPGGDVSVRLRDSHAIVGHNAMSGADIGIKVDNDDTVVDKVPVVANYVANGMAGVVKTGSATMTVDVSNNVLVSTTATSGLLAQEENNTSTSSCAEPSEDWGDFFCGFAPQGACVDVNGTPTVGPYADHMGGADTYFDYRCKAAGWSGDMVDGRRFIGAGFEVTANSVGDTINPQWKLTRHFVFSDGSMLKDRRHFYPYTNNESLYWRENSAYMRVDVSGAWTRVPAEGFIQEWVYVKPPVWHLHSTCLPLNSWAATQSEISAVERQTICTASSVAFSDREYAQAGKVRVQADKGYKKAAELAAKIGDNCLDALEALTGVSMPGHIDVTLAVDPTKWNAVQLATVENIVCGGAPVACQRGVSAPPSDAFWANPANSHTNYARALARASAGQCFHDDFVDVGGNVTWEFAQRTANNFSSQGYAIPAYLYEEVATNYVDWPQYPDSKLSIKCEANQLVQDVFDAQGNGLIDEPLVLPYTAARAFAGNDHYNSMTAVCFFRKLRSTYGDVKFKQFFQAVAGTRFNSDKKLFKDYIEPVFGTPTGPSVASTFSQYLYTGIVQGFADVEQVYSSQQVEMN